MFKRLFLPLLLIGFASNAMAVEMKEGCSYPDLIASLELNLCWYETYDDLLTDADRKLNEVYKELQAHAKIFDASPALAKNETPTSIQLRDAQRAWIKFRDTDCGLETLATSRPSFAAHAAIKCEYEMTVARTEKLQSLSKYLDEICDPECSR